VLLPGLPPGARVLWLIMVIGRGGDINLLIGSRAGVEGVYRGLGGRWEIEVRGSPAPHSGRRYCR